MDVRYAAGFFDGEGSISVLLTRTLGEKVLRGTPGKVYHKYSLRVQVTNTKRSILDEYQSQWGGSVYVQTKAKKHHRLDCHVWTLNGKNAKPFLEDVKPHLKLKCGQAELALEFIALPRGWNAQKRLGLRNEIIALNNSPQETDPGFAGPVLKGRTTPIRH